jgi:hypothetical protein
MSASVACNGQNALLHSANQIEFDLTIIPLASFRQADMVKNMASDVYLYRKDRRWQKFSKIDEIVLTGVQAVYQGVTGSNSSDQLTIASNRLFNGDAVYFQVITGGSALAVNVTYYVINKSGNTFQLASTVGGSALNLGSDITAGTLVQTQPDMNVWSSEYRDLFGNTTNLFAGLGTNSAGGAPFASATPFSAAAAVIPSSFTGGSLTATTIGSYPGGLSVRGTSDLSTAISDEISHTDLRQSVIKKTHWRFRQANSATPTYLYATWADGDQISNEPPETV